MHFIITGEDESIKIKNGKIEVLKVIGKYLFPS
jgi:hypothetical protein